MFQKMNYRHCAAVCQAITLLFIVRSTNLKHHSKPKKLFYQVPVLTNFI